jgi:hypothetical protein
MRTFALAFGVSISLVAACASPPPGELTSSSGATSGGTTGNSSGDPGGTGSSTTGGGTTAREYFDANIKPFLDNGTGSICAECHSSQYTDAFEAPDFLGASPDQFYDSLVGDINYVNADPGSSKFLLIHATPVTYTADQHDKVETWLQMEADDRFGGSGSTTGGTTGGGDPGPTGEELVAEFGACMTLADWTGTGMHMVSAQGTLADGPCHKCHGSGVGSNYMTSPIGDASINEGFEANTHLPFIPRLVTWTIDPDTGKVTGLVQSYRWRDKGGEGTAHPKYVMTQLNLDAMDAWFNLVNDKCFGGGGGGGSGGGGGAGGGI